MEDACCCSIAAAPDDANDVTVAVSGPVESGRGGLYHSLDGGGHWVWESDGLPAGAELFRKDLFDWGGCEIAVAAGGAAVAVSKLANAVFHRPSPAAPWSRAGTDFRPGAFPVSVTADAAGSFLLAVWADGIWRSLDGGRTWARVRAGNAVSVAADLSMPGRLAAGTDEGLLLSNDGGTTWRLLDEALPNRRNPVAGFGSGRVLAGTHGNGVFGLRLE
jgi:hypothetical protein